MRNASVAGASDTDLVRKTMQRVLDHFGAQAVQGAMAEVSFWRREPDLVLNATLEAEGVRAEANAGNLKLGTDLVAAGVRVLASSTPADIEIALPLRHDSA